MLYLSSSATWEDVDTGQSFVWLIEVIITQGEGVERVGIVAGDGKLVVLQKSLTRLV
jgi:hypothetical protein